MCISKRVLVAGLLSCVVTPSLNAIRYSRPVSQVSPSVVSKIRSALASNKPKLVLKHLRDNGLSINSQLTDQHETALHLVAQLGKQETAEQLLAQGGSGARVNVRDRKGKTPLAYARDNGHTDLAELLQTYTQAELAGLQNTTKRQDLFAAAANNDRAGAERLLAEGADVRERKKHGPTAYMQLGFKTPFHIAFEAEHYSLAAFLLKEAQGLNGLDEQGWTPLMLAVMADDWDMVRELIVDGADIFAGYRRSSPIQNALDVAKMMKSETQLVDIFVEEKGAGGVAHSNGETIPFIELALAKGYMGVGKLLLEHGAEKPAIRKSLSRLNFWSPLAVAVIDNDWETVRELVKDRVDVFTPYRQNILDVAAKVENKSELLHAFTDEVGVDAQLDNSYDETLLILAAKKDDMEAIELLLERGADANAQGNKGQSALQLLTWGKSIEGVKLLLEHGAGINSQSSRDLSTALMYAVWNVTKPEHLELVKFLLAAGADPNLQKDDGETTLMTVTRHGETQLVKLLLAYGAGVNIKTKSGKTALDIVEARIASLSRRELYRATDMDDARSMRDIATILRAARQQLAVSVPLALQ